MEQLIEEVNSLPNDEPVPLDLLRNIEKRVLEIIQETVAEVSKVINKRRVERKEVSEVRELLLGLKEKVSFDKITELDLAQGLVLLDIKFVVSTLHIICYDHVENGLRNSRDLLSKLNKLFNKGEITQKIQELEAKYQ